MNRKFRVLIAEDEEVLAKTAREFLESRGYEVVMAYTPEEAMHVLQERWVHVAVVDMRLDDNSDIDRTGINVLKNSARDIPKLLWTAYHKDYQDVVAAMKSDGKGPLPPAVDFVAKKEGLPRLGEAVAEALERYMPLNLALRIDWRSYHSFSQLTEMLFAEDGRLLNPELAEELEDLFRLLFRGTDISQTPQITIDQLLIPGKGYAILGIYAFKEDGSNIPYIVTFGQKEVVKKEAANFRDAVPRPIQTSNLVKDNEAATIHFAATAYRLVEGQLDTIDPFSIFYQTNDLAIIQDSVKNLYSDNLIHWHQQDREEKSVSELHQFYLHAYQATVGAAYEVRLADNLAEICRTVQSADLGRVLLTKERLELGSALNDYLTYVNPLLLLKKPPVLSETVQWGRIHGQVSTETILVDKKAHTWLIDFTQVRSGPLVHEFTHFEVQLKGQLLGRRNLSTILKFEQALLDPEGDYSDVPGDMEKVFQIVHMVPYYAQRLAVCSEELYQLGLYYQALAFLLTFDPGRLYTQVELQPYFHMLLTASQVATRFLRTELAETQATVPSLFIDETKRQVYVNGQRIDLSAREYKLLLYFQQHADITRSREEIVLEGFGDAAYEEYADKDRVNNAISRLRDKIGAHFIATVTGQGYRFVS